MGRLIGQCESSPSFDVTTPHDSFCLFTWNHRELLNSLLALYVTDLKVVLNLQPFERLGRDSTYFGRKGRLIYPLGNPHHCAKIQIYTLTPLIDIDTLTRVQDYLTRGGHT